MSVANPWMLASPAPDTSHWLAGSPGFWFSQVTGLTVGPQALAAATCGCRGPLTAAAMSPAASNARTPIRRHTPTRILFAITLLSRAPSSRRTIEQPLPTHESPRFRDFCLRLERLRIARPAARLQRTVPARAASAEPSVIRPAPNISITPDSGGAPSVRTYKKRIPAIQRHAVNSIGHQLRVAAAGRSARANDSTARLWVVIDPPIQFSGVRVSPRAAGEIATAAPAANQTVLSPWSGVSVAIRDSGLATRVPLSRLRKASKAGTFVGVPADVAALGP